jgi:hypothetical protein
MVSPISFNNSWHALLSGCICSYVINMGSINCCNFFKFKFHWILVHKTSEFIWLCWVLIKHVNIEIANYYHGTRNWHFWKWIMNIDKDNVEGLYIAIIWITFLVFVLNVDAMYLTPKDVKVLCDDKVMKLSYIIIVPFWPFTLIIECVLVSMFKDVLLNINVLKCVSMRHNMWIVLRLYLEKTSFLM